MRIQSITTPQTSAEQTAFRSSYVTLSEKNLGRKIAENVVDTFNGKLLPQIKESAKKEAQEIINITGRGTVINSPNDYQENINFFALAAGSGSRFKELAETVGEYNKISLPFKIGQNENIHMLDFAMTMGKYFIGNEGVNKIIAQQPTGSFGDIVQHYLNGNPIKDTVVCCGDNVFGDSAFDMMKFFTKTINNPNKHVALVGVGRTPEQVAKRFGVLEVEGSLSNEALKLKGFSEKPELEIAQNLAVDGKNIANTGLFYLSKEAMINLINEIKAGVNNIAKNDIEKYDFANAVKYVHSKLPAWFGIRSTEGADVKVVQQWEDVGEPKALYEFAQDVKNGEYLSNFPEELATKIQSAFAKRINLESETPHIIFTDSLNVSSEQIKNAKNVDGVNIIV